MAKKAKPQPGSSQFDGLFEAIDDASPAPSTDETKTPFKPVPKKKKSTKRSGKSSDPNFQKVTVYIPKALHKKMKQYVLDNETEHSLLIEQAVDDFLNKGETD